MAAEWSFFLHNTILNTVSGTGQITELTAASNRRLSFSLTEGASLSFSMPGSHWQTALVQPGLVDVLVYYGPIPVQRFLVNSMQAQKDGGLISCSFTAASYRSLLDRWIVHDNATRDFNQIEQTQIAWTLISEAEARSSENWNLSRGIAVTDGVDRLRDRLPSPDANGPAHGYDAGAKVGEMVANLGNLVDGFEWDIEPHPTSPATGLRFNTWYEGLRRQHEGTISPFVLDDGGAVASWSMQRSLAEYGNVVRLQGRAPTGENSTTAVGPVSWRPATKNPSPASPYGRWERADSGDETTQSELDAAASGLLTRYLDPAAQWSVTLRPGRWSPSALWLGDYARMIVSGGPFADVDMTMRVQSVDVDLTESGTQTVSLDLGRPPASYVSYRRSIENRLARLERR